ncbi:60S ribosomal protein L27 [Glugoides intestinalis]
MIFKPNMIVLITNGCLAGKKAVVVKELENNMVLLAGISRIPSESPDYLPPWQKRKNAKFLTFIKKLNIKHALATRYRADVGLDKLSTEGIDNISNKTAINNKANKILKGAFEANKAKWLFTQLKF